MKVTPPPKEVWIPEEYLLKLIAKGYNGALAHIYLQHTGYNNAHCYVKYGRYNKVITRLKKRIKQLEEEIHANCKN